MRERRERENNIVNYMFLSHRPLVRARAPNDARDACLFEKPAREPSEFFLSRKFPAWAPSIQTDVGRGKGGRGGRGKRF